MSEVLEMAKVVADPISKLIDVFAKGCGKLYEPTHVKRMAKAKAEELALIGDQITNGLYLPAKYENGKITIDATQQPELLERSQQRLLLEKCQKQQNIESVFAQAYELLKNENEAADEPINIDWILKFFDSVAYVSDEDMQNLWGKVLAGEIKQPKSFSLRTLEALKNFSVQDALLVERALKCSVHNVFVEGFIYRDDLFLKNHNISYKDIVDLQELNIVSYDSKLDSRLCYKDGVLPFNLDNILLIFHESGSDKIIIPQYGLTSIGNDLAKLIKDNNDIIALECCKLIIDNSKNKDITIHNIERIQDGVIKYHEGILKII